MIGFPDFPRKISIADAIGQIPSTFVAASARQHDRRQRDKKKSGVARFKRFVIKLTGCVGRGKPLPQILRKIFRRYIQNSMNQKISITAKPWSTG